MNLRILPLLVTLAVPSTGCERIGETLVGPGGRVAARHAINSCRKQSLGNVSELDRCLLEKMELGPYQRQCGIVNFEECRDAFVSTLADARPLKLGE